MKLVGITAFLVSLHVRVFCLPLLKGSYFTYYMSAIERN